MIGGCPQCGFGLWTPLARLSVSDVGLYRDARFPGRLLLSIRDHYEHLDEAPVPVAIAFMKDIQAASRALRTAFDDVTRVNVSILGNAEPHVHAHLIPRRASDPLPTKAPWEDPRPRAELDSAATQQIADALRETFGVPRV